MVKLRVIKKNESKQLANLLRQDPALREELGFPNADTITPESVHADILTWQKKKSATCYGIFRNNEIAGMISLSHQNEEERTARIGYWIGTAYRRKRIASDAFAEVLSNAQKKGFATVSSKIDKTNHASISIWEKYEPKTKEISTKQVEVEIDIRRQPLHEPDACKGTKLV